jgi:hypothetical protein
MGILDLVYKFRIILLLTVLVFILIGLLYREYNIGNYFEPKYIICFPQGGLINMLRCTITAYNYAIKYNRILVIDSRRNWFKESLYDYFFIHCPYVYVGDIDPLYKRIEMLSTYPNKEDLTNLQLDSDKISRYDINLDKDYDESIILYSHYGGSSHSKSIKPFFEIVSLKNKVIRAFKSARDKLPASYVGVHIHNEDEIIGFLDKHRELLKDKTVFIASRTKEIVDLFKKEFNAVSFSDVPYNNSKKEPIDVDISKYNLDSIVDLLLLASSSELYSGEKSFSYVASELHKSPELLKRLTTESAVEN